MGALDLLQLGCFVTERRMVLGIKQRAEALAITES